MYSYHVPTYKLVKKIAFKDKFYHISFSFADCANTQPYIFFLLKIYILSFIYTEKISSFIAGILRIMVCFEKATLLSSSLILLSVIYEKLGSIFKVSYINVLCSHFIVT